MLLLIQDGIFGKSDPKLFISRCNEDQSYTLVWESEVCENQLNPKFKPTKINVNQLCGGAPLIMHLWLYSLPYTHFNNCSVSTQRFYVFYPSQIYLFPQIFCLKSSLSHPHLTGDRRRPLKIEIFDIDEGGDKVRVY